MCCERGFSALLQDTTRCDKIGVRRNIVLLFLFLLTAPCILTASPTSSLVDTTENSWVSKAAMNKARCNLGVAVVNGKIYAIGGRMLVYQDSLRTESKEVGINEEYDPATNTWTLKKPMPGSLSDFATAVYEGKIYCIGGGVSEFFNFTTGRWDTKLSQGTNAVYDPATDTWEMKTPMPIPKPSAQAHVINGQIYVVGGFPNNTLNEVYDPKTDTWAMKASSIDLIGSSAVVDSKIYCIGGANKWRIYDPEADSWSVGVGGLPDFLTGAYVVTTTGMMAPEQIYILYNPNYAPSGYIYENQVFDPETESWMSGAKVPTNRDDFAVAVADDLIYVIGGLTITVPVPTVGTNPTSVTTIYSTVEQYTPFGYGTTPPVIDVASPANQIYNASSVSLDFMVNKPAEWTGYSLDGQDNVTVAGNTTLDGLPNGLHSVMVYAEDSLGNMGASETVSFTVEVPFPTALVVASAVIVSVIGLGLLVYFKKRHAKSGDKA
jgi:N-acetylneuraminic acid mutarotase